MARKTPVSIKIDERDLALIDQGAESRHMDRTSFLVEAGVAAAESAILDRMDTTVFYLPEEAVAVLNQATENPSVPTSALRQAAESHLRRKRERAR